MAMDIQTKMVIQDSSVKNTQKTNTTGSARADETAVREAKQAKLEARKEQAAKQEEARKAVIEEQTKATLDETKGRVISESKDGDTLRASERSIEALNDGIVLPKQTDAETAAGVKAASEAEEPSEDITNLAGYSSSQIDALYRQGKISIRDRDEELEKREEIREAAAAEEDDDDKTNAAVNAAENDKDRNEKKTGAANNIKEDDEKKADAMKEQQERRENAAEARSRAIEQESEALANFENTMNTVIGEQMREGLDPNLERFGTVEGFNVSINR
ncbi:MAG: hypothetical protein IJ796_05310 [Lachnospiraceae bacterium]|nr:hypothetical protein [Lachnospiraceae bacterium]